MEEEALASRLIAAREKAGLSAENICEKCGFSPEDYARWESGESEPETKDARILSDALGVSSDWLLFGLADRKSVATMFPKGAAEGKNPMSDWRYILGIALAFLGVACLAMMFVSVQTNGYYDTFASLMKSCLLSPSLYVFAAMIIGGIVLCVVAGVSKIRRYTRPSDDEKQSDFRKAQNNGKQKEQ